MKWSHGDEQTHTTYIDTYREYLSRFLPKKYHHHKFLAGCFCQLFIFYCLLYFLPRAGRNIYEKWWEYIICWLLNCWWTRFYHHHHHHHSLSLFHLNEWKKEYIDWGLRWQTNLNVSRIILMIFQRMAIALKNIISIHTSEYDEKFFFKNFHMNELKKTFLLKIYHSFFLLSSLNHDLLIHMTLSISTRLIQG